MKDKGARSKSRQSYIDLTAGIRMVIVSEAFSDMRLTEEQGDALQGKLIDLL